MRERGRAPVSHARITVTECRVFLQFAGCSGSDDGALFDDGVPVGDPVEGLDVLVYYEDGLAAGLEVSQAFQDFGANEGASPSVASSRISLGSGFYYCATLINIRLHPAHTSSFLPNPY